MKFVVYETIHNWDYETYEIKEFNSLEEIMNFFKETGEIIILKNEFFWDLEKYLNADYCEEEKEIFRTLSKYPYAIEIYNYWRE